MHSQSAPGRRPDRLDQDDGSPLMSDVCSAPQNSLSTAEVVTPLGRFFP
jgi:hypothetical protein